MSEDINIGAISEALNNKMDRDNLNASDTGTAVGGSWSFPSNTYINLTLQASGSTYTAPADGYMYLGKAHSAVGGLIDMYNLTSQYRLQTMNAFAGTYMLQTIPCKKGDIVRINYVADGALDGFKFIYAVGSEP
jgi:hypothetical protein